MGVGMGVKATCNTFLVRPYMEYWIGVGGGGGLDGDMHCVQCTLYEQSPIASTHKA